MDRAGSCLLADAAAAYKLPPSRPDASWAFTPNLLQPSLTQPSVVSLYPSADDDIDNVQHFTDSGSFVATFGAGAALALHRGSACACLHGGHSPWLP